MKATIALATVFLLVACDRTNDAPAGATDSPAASGLFVEQAADLGVEFHHFNGMAGDLHMAEITGAGGALFDYDRDGDLDLYLVQGTMLHPGKDIEAAINAPRHGLPLTDRLYRNDLEPGDPLSLRFTDVTEAAGTLGTGYGMGVTAGDYDGDGRPDLYVTNHGDNQLLRNNGDGTFTDVTVEAGAEDDAWSVAATFVDYDRDGWLDLFVGNYLRLPRDSMDTCKNLLGAPDYCGPENFRPVADRLFHNNGNGTFTEVADSAGVSSGFGPALGVVAADFNGDGWSDLYVTNDARANNYWLNRHDGTFEDQALLAGCAVNDEGRAEASMGVDAADFDADGDLDLFMTHLISETNTLYVNDGTGFFDDQTVEAGLGSASRLHTGFGTGWLDFDADGWLDLVVANGAVKKIEALDAQGDPFPLHETNQLFRNSGGGRFEEVTERGGAAFDQSDVSRGMMLGDLDNDGDTDLVISNNNGPVRVLLRQGSPQRWLGLELVTGHDHLARAALGAEAELLQQTPVRRRRVRVDGSFASASDPRILFALDPNVGPADVRVYWPDGTVEDWHNLEINRYTQLRQGEATTP